MLLGTYTSIFQTPLGAFTTLFPLAVVLSISMVQEGYADYKRHQADKETNAKPGLIVNNDEMNECSWKDIKCGDIILVKNQDALPADIIILATSEIENSCYIETSPIDGETNLKLRKGPIINNHYLAEHHINHIKEKKPNNKLIDIMKKLKCLITCDLPNAHIHHFNGNILIPDDINDLKNKNIWNHLNKNVLPIPLDIDNLLLRGSLLRNTSWVLGCVIYTGSETKIMKNAHHTPSKMSHMDILINRAIYIIFITDIILVLISTLLLINWEKEHFEELSYIGYQNNNTPMESFFYNIPTVDWQRTPMDFLPSFLTFIVLYNNFIPISLYVTLEIVIFILLFYINNDIKLYEKERDIPAKARSSNITDLGQIEYIFSDKTGTLTENKMEFRRCLINDIVYGESLNSINKKDNTLINNMIDDNKYSFSGYDEMGGFPYKSIEQLSDLLKQGKKNDIFWFFLILSLCHSVVVEEKDNGDIIYQAESPDEGALIKMSNKLGIKLLNRVADIINIELPINNKMEITSWRLIASNKFDSDRKRMSVLVQSPFNNKYYLLCKGADSSMINCSIGLNNKNDNLNHIKNKYEEEKKELEENNKKNKKKKDQKNNKTQNNNNNNNNINNNNDNKYKDMPLPPNTQINEGKLNDVLHVFASEGLRTLVLGYREIPIDEVNYWIEKFNDACAAITNRDEELAKCSDKIEKDLILVGATGIEDKLQDGVPETIYDLAQAGIKFWVLTGDKKETAINIGFSCKVLRDYMKQYIIEGNDDKKVIENICKYYLKLVYYPSITNIDDWEYPSELKNNKNNNNNNNNLMKNLKNLFHNNNNKQLENEIKALNMISNILGKDSLNPNGQKLIKSDNDIDIDEMGKKKSLNQGSASKLLKHQSSSSSSYDNKNDDKIIPIKEKSSSKKRFSKYIEVNKIEFNTNDSKYTENALILEGNGLSHIFGNAIFEFMLFQIAHHCHAVIACRVAPRQKALLVKMVHHYVVPKPVTLSIGDGANDVGMIQEAQVGIGLSGLEGQQAVNASDFAISRFRFLKRLLLVHGRWNYRRVSIVVLYSFFKNLVLVLTLFYFNIYNGFSGSTLFDDQLIGLYNFFLGLAIIGVGIYDKDISEEYILKNPSLYISGRKNLDLNIETICKWVMTGLVHSVIIFFLTKITFVYGPNEIVGDDIYTYGTILFSILIMGMNMKVLKSTRTFVIGKCCQCCPNIVNQNLNLHKNLDEHYVIEMIDLENNKDNDENGDDIIDDDDDDDDDNYDKIINEKCCMNCSNFGWTIFFWIGSVLFYFIVLVIYSFMLSFRPEFYYVGINAISLPIFWMQIILISFLTFLFDIFFTHIKNTFYPSIIRLGIENNYIEEMKKNK